VSTSPSDHAVDLFYITGACSEARGVAAAAHAEQLRARTRHADNRNELPSADRFKDVQECVVACLALLAAQLTR
jgi:hypothetical protein